MRLIPYLAYLLLIACHQVILSDLTSVFGVRLSLTAFLVIAVASNKSEMTSLRFGFAAGLTLFAGFPELMGVGGLVTAALGLAAYHARERLNLDSLYSKLLLVLTGTIIYNACMLLVKDWSGFFHLFVVNALPNAVYTTLLAWLFFQMQDGRLTFRRIRSVF